MLKSCLGGSGYMQRFRVCVQQIINDSCANLIAVILLWC